MRTAGFRELGGIGETGRSKVPNVRRVRESKIRDMPGVRSGPGAARTIPLFHTISARPPKQPRMVRTFLKVHTRPRLAYALRCRGY
jgi:hypothetical protein